MEKKKTKIAVLGAGISGLTIAYYLSKNEDYEVKVYEKNAEPGGSMTTIKINDFLIDFGPNSGLETTPLIQEMVNEIGLSDELVYANEEAKKRYILRNNKLHALPTSPVDFLKSSLFTFKGKLRLMAEPFIPRYMGNEPESLYDFTTRRLGQEFADYAIDPFVSGVYAGDPKKLCVKSAFSKVKALEDNYGGLIKGMILGAKERKKRKETSKNYAKMFTFLNGMQTFPKTLAKHLGDKITFNANITEIYKADFGFIVNGKANNPDYVYERFDIVISTLPAYVYADIIEELEADIKYNLLQIPYPKVNVLFAVFKKEQIKQPLDGFGFLIPGNENKQFLGAIWSSTIFPNRAPEGYAAFTIFTGGAKTPYEYHYTDEERQKLALAEFKEIMGIEGPFVFIKEMQWPKAIPQYNLNYIEMDKAFNYFEDVNKGLILAGNYRGGISIGDCIKNSQTVLEKVKNLVENNYVPEPHKIDHDSKLKPEVETE